MRALASTAIVAALLLAACGGDEPETTTVTTTVAAPTTVTETVTETETVQTDTSVPAEPASPVAFQMPSGNIGCLFGFRRLRCDILSGLDPEPTEVCDFDWVGVDMGVTGPATANCGSDTVFDADAPTLAYGSTWSRGGITCESDENGLSCTNREGHGFALARGSWSAS